MDDLKILLCFAQQLVHYYYPALLAMLKSVLLDIQIYLNIQQVLTKVLIITFVRAAADAAGNKFRPNGPF
jgi:hypothetical protein